MVSKETRTRLALRIGALGLALVSYFALDTQPTYAQTQLNPDNTIFLPLISATNSTAELEDQQKSANKQETVSEQEIGPLEVTAADNEPCEIESVYWTPDLYLIVWAYTNGIRFKTPPVGKTCYIEGIKVHLGGVLKFFSPPSFTTLENGVPKTEVCSPSDQNTDPTGYWNYLCPFRNEESGVILTFIVTPVELGGADLDVQLGTEKLAKYPISVVAEIYYALLPDIQGGSPTMSQ